MRKVEHIGIAVRNLEAAQATYAALFGEEHYKIEGVESEGVRTAFFRVGPNKIELLEGTGPDSPISKFIEKRGEGIHHLAFDVEDIEAEVRRLKEKGFQVLNEQPRPGADGKVVVFLHPKSSHGVLVELCQDRN